MKTCEVCTLYAAVNGCCKRISNLYYLYITLRNNLTWCTVSTLLAVVRDCCRGIFKLVQAIIEEMITMEMETCEVCTLHAFT